MNKIKTKLTVCLMFTCLSFLALIPVVFAEDQLSSGLASHAINPAGHFSGNSAEAKPSVYRSQKVANNFSDLKELVGLLKKMNRNIAKLSARVSQIQPVAVRAFIPSQPSAKRGKAIFHEMQCISCHGVNGKGHEAKTNMKDEMGLPIMAADLTQPSSFGNGNSRKDIFRTVITGLNGSPMPSYEDLFVNEEHRAWDLVEYVYSLQEDTLARFLP